MSEEQPVEDVRLSLDGLHVVIIVGDVAKFFVAIAQRKPKIWCAFLIQ
jgi:hypothetical protein